MAYFSKSTVFATSQAPVNIALVKYWGKADEEMIIPLNSSLSLTLDSNDIGTRTTVAISPNFKDIKLWIDGQEYEITKRIAKIIKLFKERARSHEQIMNVEADSYVEVGKEFLQSAGVHISSHNTFPPATGLASSASGTAALVLALAKVFNFHEEFQGELSTVARLGSGSACRSINGGFVVWERGFEKEEELKMSIADVSRRSIAYQIDDGAKWEDLQVIILVASAEKKKVSSTNGMKNTVETSALLKYRVEHVVPNRIKEVTAAIHSTNWQSLSQLIMQDSNQLHAVCMDTYPPLFYMSSTTKKVVDLVHDINEIYSENIVAYSVDAGENMFLFTLKKHSQKIAFLLKQIFDLKKEQLNTKAMDLIQSEGQEQSEIYEALMKKGLKEKDFYGKITKILFTTVGKGAHVPAGS